MPARGVLPNTAVRLPAGCNGMEGARPLTRAAMRPMKTAEGIRRMSPSRAPSGALDNPFAYAAGSGLTNKTHANPAVRTSSTANAGQAFRLSARAP